MEEEKYFSRVEHSSRNTSGSIYRKRLRETYFHLFIYYERKIKVLIVLNHNESVLIIIIFLDPFQISLKKE